MNSQIMGHQNTHPALILGEIGLLRSLGELDIPIILGSESKKSAVWYSKYARERYLLPSYDSEAFIEKLCEIGSKLDQKAVIFSDDDRAILNISNNRQRLEPYYLLLYPSAEMVNSILDKQLFIELSELYDLPAPGSYQVNHPSQITAVADQISYPCIIKPTQRHFWWGKAFVESVGFYKKAIKCMSRDYFVDIYHKIAAVNPSVVVQEYVEGPDRQHVSANLFVDEAGAVRGYYIAQKLRIYPIKAGVGTYIVTLDDPEVLNICIDIIQKLELKGLVNIQFKQDSRSGQYKLMEIHARNSMWSLLGNKAGAGLAQLYYRYVTGQPISSEMVRARPNVKYFDLLRDLQAMIQYRAEGLLTIREWLQSFRGDRSFALFSLSDPKPMAMQLWFSFQKRWQAKKKARSFEKNYFTKSKS